MPRHFSAFRKLNVKISITYVDFKAILCLLLSKPGFGQPHGATPFAGPQFGNEQVLLFLCGKFMKHGDRALCQAPEHDDRRRRGGLHLQNRRIPAQGYFAFAAVTELRSQFRIHHGFINILERIRSHHRMLIAAHKFRAGFVRVFVGRTHHVAADFIVDIEDAVDVVHPVVILVSVKGQELFHAEPFFDLEHDVPRLIQPITMCHTELLFSYFFAESLRFSKLVACFINKAYFLTIGLYPNPA